MGIGVILGSVIFLGIIKLLLKHFYMQTYYSIIGFTLGSALVLYTPISFDITGVFSVLLLIFGLFVASKFEKAWNYNLYVNRSYILSLRYESQTEGMFSASTSESYERSRILLHFLKDYNMLLHDRRKGCQNPES